MIHDDKPSIEEALIHAGIKGMHWGIRKEDRAIRRENKAQKFDAKAASAQKEITALKAKPKSMFYGNRRRRQIAELNREKVQAQQDAESKRQGKLTSKQKTIIKGAAVVGVTLALATTYSKGQSGDLNRLALKGKDFLNGKNKGAYKTNVSLADKTLDADGIMSKVVKDINPNYGTTGTKVNCRRATFAYEMRRRGMDVAATRTTNGSGQTAIGINNALTPGKKFQSTSMFSVISKRATEMTKFKKDPNSPTPIGDLLTNKKWGDKLVYNFMDENVMNGGTAHTAVFKALAKHPNGARGELGVGYMMGGGHSMAWEIVNGKPVIFDTQAGIAYKNAGQFKKFADNVGEAAITRLDDKPLNTDYLMRWVKNAK